MSENRKRIFWPMLTIVSIAIGAAVFASARSSRRTLATTEADRSGMAASHSVSTSTASAIKALNSTSPQGPLQQQGPVQMVRFTVYDAGIFPSEARVRAGEVAIYVEDMSGSSTGLIVQGDSLQAVGQVLRGAHQRGHARLRLEPGRYRIVDATRPSNSATLIVEP